MSPDDAGDDGLVVIDAFHRLYYDRGLGGATWKQTFWMGVETWKTPLDLWVYQEILDEVRPDLVIETGTAHGGSAFFLAHMLDILGGSGSVVSVDSQFFEGRPAHPRISYLFGSSLDDAVLAAVRDRATAAETVLVCLDSDHRASHVAEELRAYAPLVTIGSYLIVEDTNLNGRPAYDDFGPGPGEAVDQFIAGNGDFTVDRGREKFLFTFNPGGYLRRIR